MALALRFNMIKLNLGCGSNKKAGFVNVDQFGDPDLRHNLEEFPWPWEDNSVAEIWMIHVLEHLGQSTAVYLRIIQELYRICAPGALIRIHVPHFRHDFFFADPTHVRVVTPLGLQLFSQRLNRHWQSVGASNSPLGIYLNVDFELKHNVVVPGQAWRRRHPDVQVNGEQLMQEAEIYNNMIEEFQMVLEVIKQPPHPPAGSANQAAPQKALS